MPFEDFDATLGVPLLWGFSEYLYPMCPAKSVEHAQALLGGLFSACAARMAWARASNSLAAAPRGKQKGRG